MQTALTQLGFQCFHSIPGFFPTIQETDLWIEALHRKFGNKGPPLTKEVRLSTERAPLSCLTDLLMKDFDRMLGHYSAVSADAPAICFAEELIKFYPEAKVILIERDIDTWHKSYCDTIIKNMHDPWNDCVAGINPGYIGKLYWVHASWRLLWMGAQTAEEHQDKAKAKYREHYQLVRSLAPKDRLLEFKLTDGWTPLCKFLGVQPPAPDSAFPKVNDTEANNDVVRLCVQRGFASVMKKVGYYAGAVATAALAWFLVESVRARLALEAA